jgi:hypothetical protein
MSPERLWLAKEVSRAAILGRNLPRKVVIVVRRKHAESQPDVLEVVDAVDAFRHPPRGVER